MLPNSGYNVKRYKELQSVAYKGHRNYLRRLQDKLPFIWKVSDLTLAQLQTLSLEGREPDPNDSTLYQVPTLDEYMARLGNRLNRPIVFEIKKLNSQSSQKKLEEIIINYSRSIGGNQPSGTRYNDFPYQLVSVINLTGLKNSKNIDPQDLCKTLKYSGINIYRGWTHDSVCDFYYQSEFNPVQGSLKERVLRFGKQVAVKHHIEQTESNLDPANYYKPRLVHLEPKRLDKPDRFIYTPVSSTQEALTQLGTINKNNLIVFVHGRGRHPEKGEDLLLKLADQHDAALLMFDWDSWICREYCAESIKAVSSKHPYGNATAAAPELAKFLKHLHTFKQGKPNLKVSILVHSMGNIVFKEMIEKYWDNESPTGPFIDNLILNSADIKREHHKNWLEQVSMADDIFITMSGGDLVLGAVELLLYKPLLGQGFKDGDPENSLAKNAHYLDFTGVSASHRKFGSGNSVLQQFFASALSVDSWNGCPIGEIIAMETFQNKCVTTP